VAAAVSAPVKMLSMRVCLCPAQQGSSGRKSRRRAGRPERNFRRRMLPHGPRAAQRSRGV